MTIICARFTRSLLPQYGFQLEQNSPAYFRGGSRNPLPLGAHICWQADFRPEWKYIATRTACALCLSSQATWACVGILGNLKEILTPLPYLDGHPWHWSSISGDRRGGGHPQPRTHPVSFMDDSNETPRMLYFFVETLYFAAWGRLFRRWYYLSLVMILPLLEPLSKFPLPFTNRHLPDAVGEHHWLCMVFYLNWLM